MKPLPLLNLLFVIVATISAAVLFAVIGCRFLGYGFCPSDEVASYLGSGAIHLFLLCGAMAFLWKNDLRTTLQSLGLPGSIRYHILFTAMGFMMLFTVMFWFNLLAIVVGLNDQYKVAEKVEDLPLAILVLAVVGAPITEELFFRATLVPRLGILGSAMIFGFLHLTYGSLAEVLGVFVIALVLGALYRLSGSIAPCIAVHMGYNFLSILLMKLMA